MSAVIAAGTAHPTYLYTLRLADTALVLAQRLSAWIGHAPAIEEDLGISNIALDLIDRKSTRLNSSHIPLSRMPSSA